MSLSKSETKIIIEVTSGMKSIYEFRTHLYSQGLRFSKRKKIYQAETYNLEFVNRINDFCKNNGLICYTYEENMRRSANYRDNFFSVNKPMFGSKYICAYCFKPLSIDKVEVDHIISIKKAKSNRIARKFINKINLENINDEKNLCACCRSCNASKGSKAGLWIIRGYLGKKKWFVISVYISMIVILSLITYFIFYFL